MSLDHMESAMPDHGEILANLNAAKVARHPDLGIANYEAYLYGHCHILAIALQQRIGGELIAVVRPDDEEHLIHAGVRINDKIHDVVGVTEQDRWHMGWAYSHQDPDCRIIPVTRDRLERMMPHRPVTKKAIDAAKSVVDALEPTVGTPPKLYIGRPPPGSLSWGPQDQNAKIVSLNAVRAAARHADKGPGF